MKSDPTVLLHYSVVSPVDLGRVQRELFQIQSSNLVPNRLSPKLENVLLSTGLKITDPADRQLLAKQLQFVRRTAPVVGLVFASNPSSVALSKIVKWFREFGHPNTLINVSVNSAIAGGCLVKASTKSFDFSFSKALKAKQLKLTR